MSYGYGDWNSGSSRGYEGYGYGYGYGPEGSGGFGFGAAAGNSWDLGNPDPDGAPEGGDGPGKQRQEPGNAGMHPEPEGIPGRGYGGNPDRYDPYEPYGDSRVSDHRDLYRASFDYPGDYPNDYPGDYPRDYPNDYHNDYHNDYPNDYPDYPNDYPNDYPDYPDYPNDFPTEPDPDSADFYGRPPHRDQQFQGKFRGAWGARERFPGFPPRAGGWAEPRGPPRRLLPSLFSPQTAAPEAARAFPGASRGTKRIRRGWRLWDNDCRPQRKRPRRDSVGRRRPGGTGHTDGTGTGHTDGTDNSSSDNEEGTEGESGEKEESRGEGEDEEGRDSEKGALSNPEENSQISQLRMKLQAGRKSQERQKKRHRDRMVERIQFVCSLCKFRTFFEDEIRQHLESKFHREHFQFVGSRLPPATARFLQEYVANKTRKTEERRRGIRDINAVIQQIQREQDLTQELGLEHFVRRAEAAHCSACDLLIPMHFGALQRHLRSLEHNHNRRAMLEQSKRAALAVARSILNNKVISKKLHSFLQGENPFTDDPEEKEEPEEGAGEENPQNPKNPEENPQNPEENPENSTENSMKNPHKNPEENLENSTENPENSTEKNQKIPEENLENSTKNAPKNPEENLENSMKNPENSMKNPPKNPEENPENSIKNPKKTPEGNLENSTENPENSMKNPQKFPEENLENSTENLENSTENLENSTENPEKSTENLERNPKNSKENLENLEENPENSEENENSKETAAAKKQQKDPGTDPGLGNSQKNSKNSQKNSQNSQIFPNSEESSGKFQE